MALRIPRRTAASRTLAARRPRLATARRPSAPGTARHSPIAPCARRTWRTTFASGECAVHVRDTNSGNVNRKHREHFHDCARPENVPQQRGWRVRLDEFGQGIPGTHLRHMYSTPNKPTHLVPLRIDELFLCRSKSLELILYEWRPETQRALFLALELVV